MTNKTAAAGAAAALAIFATGIVSATVATNAAETTTTTTQVLAPVTDPQMSCGSWMPLLTAGECGAAGTIRYASLNNLQGAVQFCKWKAANPGEWSRIKTYAETATMPTNIVTWLGAHIMQDIQAYFYTGAPAFTIQPNTAPNVCKTPIPAPIIAGVTPGQTDATITIAPPPG